MPYQGTQAGQEQADNMLKMRFCWCPPGKFIMGSPKAGSGRLEETYRIDDEDQVEVMLSCGFWLGKYEVTQGQWRALIGSRPWVGHEYSFYVREEENHPATFIDWYNATAFCQWMTNRERKTGGLPLNWEYLLPTEAQWEYACRARTPTAFHFGKSTSQMGKFEWWTENAFDANEKYAHPVGAKQSNRWGLHDMHGNVSEWCRDWYRKDLPGGIDPEVSQGGSERIFRGGSWADPAPDCRSARRHFYKPRICNYVLGFRVAIVQTEPATCT